MQIPIDAGQHSDLKPDSQGPFSRVSKGGIRPSSMNDEEGEMPAKRGLTMQQIRDLLRLSHEDMDVIVQRVEKADFDEWLVLWDGYNAFYDRSGPTALPMDVTRTMWGRFFDCNEPIECLVAKQNDRLVGIAHYIFHRSTTMIAPTCYMQDLFTCKEARGQGVGGALITGVYEQAKSAGSSRVYWHTHETNTIAQRLYNHIAEHSGFVLYRKDL